MKIIYLDDSTLALNLFSESVVGLDIEVTECMSVTDLIGHLKRTAYDAVLLDYYLSSGSIEEHLPHIREIFSGAIIILSSTTEERAIRECYKLGADGFVNKLLGQNIQDLLDRMRSVVHLKVTISELRRYGK